MNFPRPRIGLPLLAKELVELSARRRTYIVRVVYASLLFIAAFIAFYDILRNLRADLFAVLGHGRQMFEFLVGVQFFGVYLFMPALACGVLTSEKEQGSLGLLFLTRLGPSTILFEKLLSRLVPMFSFLLLSLPLLGFAYSLGGITEVYLWSGVWTLAISSAQMCALAVMCSAFFRNTVGAFVGAYLIGLALLFGLPVAEALGVIHLRPDYFYTARGVFPPTPTQQGWLLEGLQAVGIIGDNYEDALFTFFGPYIFFEHAQNWNSASGRVEFGTVVLRSLPILASTVGFLLLARLFVVWRAFVPSRNYLMLAFRGADRLFMRMNQNRLTQGIVLARESTALPADAPIAWRETSRKSLGTIRYLFRMFVAIEIPVIVGCVLVVGIAYDASRLEGISAMLFLLWIVAVLLVSVKSTSLVSGERSYQTLDVLLATPLTGREIVTQKYRGVRRMMWVLAVPFLTIFLFEATWKAEFWHGGYYYNYGFEERFSTPLYVTASLLSVAVYFPMIAWLSFLIGMLVRRQSRAIIASLTVIVAWCLLPIFSVLFIGEVLFGAPISGDNVGILLLLSPLSIVPINEFAEYRAVGHLPWMVVLVNFLIYGACLFVFRLLCLKLANRLLGRADG